MMQLIFSTVTNPSDPEAGILWENYVNCIAADTLAPSITRSLAAMVLTM